MPPYLKALGLFAGVLIALAVLVLWRDRPKEERPFSIPYADVERVVLAKNADTVTLEREGASWVAYGDPAVKYRAQNVKIVQFLDTLRELRVTDQISRRDDRLADYGLEGQELLRISLRGKNGKTVEGHFGKPTMDFGYVYFRRPTGGGVFLAANTVRYTAVVADWRDRAIFSLSEPAVKTVVIQTPGSTATLTRGGTDASPAWQCNGKPADAEKVRQTVSALASLTADGFADMQPVPVDPSALKGASVRIDGQLLEMGPLDKSAGRYPARVEGKPGVFWISKTDADAFLKKPSDFLSSK